MRCTPNWYVPFAQTASMIPHLGKFTRKILLFRVWSMWRSARPACRQLSLQPNTGIRLVRSPVHSVYSALILIRLTWGLESDKWLPTSKWSGVGTMGLIRPGLLTLRFIMWFVRETAGLASFERTDWIELNAHGVSLVEFLLYSSKVFKSICPSVELIKPDPTNNYIKASTPDGLGEPWKPDTDSE